MIFLILSLLFSTAVFVAFKFFNKHNINSLTAITTNYLVAIVFGYSAFWNEIPLQIVLHNAWVWMAILTGLSFIMTFTMFASVIKYYGVAMAIVSSKMSIILTVSIGFLLLGETFTLIKLSGILLALLAFYLSNMGESDLHIDRNVWIFPLILFLGTGINDSLMKLSGVNYPQRDVFQYLTATFIVAFLAGLLLVVIQVIRRKIVLKLKDILAGLFLGVINWFSTLYFIKGLYVMPMSVFLPVFNAAIVFLAAMTGLYFFKEKLSSVNKVGVVLALIAIIIITVF